MANCFITDLGCGNTVQAYEGEDGQFYAECSNCLMNAGTRSNQGQAIAAYNQINQQARTVENYRAALANGDLVITGA